MLVRENLSDKLAGIIGKRIIHNELKSGEIIYETQVSKEFGVSRSPVRDALRMLELKRLVERTTSGSYQVAELSVEYVRHFYDTINLLFRYAFSKAAEKATKNDIRSITSSMKAIEKSMVEKDFDAYLQCVTDFAQSVLKAAGNPIVERIALEMMASSERIQWAAITYLPENMVTIVGHIKQGLHNIKKKNPKEAADAFTNFVTLHIEIAMKSLQEEEAGGA